jgi:hypothetical protein
MVNVKEMKQILNQEPPEPVDKKKIQEDRKVKQIKFFRFLNDKERSKLYDLVCEKFPPFELHMNHEKIDRWDFIVATEKFINSYLFSLAMSISSAIKQDFERDHEILGTEKDNVLPFSEKKEVSSVERRYAD